MYTAFEERNVQYMADRSLTFANGAALAAKHSREGHVVLQTQTTTINAGEISTREDTCAGPRVRLLTVSRIDPRKGLRILPDVVATLVALGVDATLDIIGPAVGAPGEAERRAIESAAETRGSASGSRCGARCRSIGCSRVPRSRHLRAADAAGRRIPRVLLEAMAAGVPVVTTRVAGIPSLITDGRTASSWTKPRRGRWPRPSRGW